MSRLKPLYSLGRDQVGTLGSRNQEMEGPQLPVGLGRGSGALGAGRQGPAPALPPLKPGDLGQAALKPRVPHL